MSNELIVIPSLIIMHNLRHLVRVATCDFNGGNVKVNESVNGQLTCSAQYQLSIPCFLLAL